MAIRLVFNPKSGWTGKVKSQPITEREMFILILSAQGNSNKEIAESLGIAYQTVKNNFSRLMRKLGATNNANALVIAMQSGMISLEVISDELDESLPQEKRDRAKIYIEQEREKTKGMSKEELEEYMEEKSGEALGIRKKKGAK
jgi:DNA-binding CsgD family transcriptional regulator